jgi:hypothetical protein
MAGIAEGSEWIEVSKLGELLKQLPPDAMVMATPLGNIAVYDKAGPLEGQQIAYIDLLSETLYHEPEPTDGARMEAPST